MLFQKPSMQLSFLVLSTLLLPTQASPSPKESWNQLRGLSWPALFGRGSCSGTTCGWSGQLCCASGEACYTDSSDQAQCSATTTAAALTTSTDSGYWQYYTTVYTETDLVTVTSIYSSSWCATTTAATTWASATATAITCDSDENETACGSICCSSEQYCYVSGQCEAVAASPSLYYSSYWTSTASASAALRPTSSTDVVVTATNSPTTTVPYIAPVATGANITLTGGASDNSHGLSGGAIAGIVIGTLLGAFFLLLLCLYCCCAGFWAACCGRGRRREREEVIVSHRHRSGSGAAPVGRSRWYGRPARVETGREREGGLFKEGLGIAALLAGVAAVLGLKRRHDRRKDEKSEVSDNTYSYYTSESE